MGEGEACGDRQMGNLSVKNGSTGTEVGNRTVGNGRLRPRRRRLKQQKERKERKRVRRLDFREKNNLIKKKKNQRNTS